MAGRVRYLRASHVPLRPRYAGPAMAALRLAATAALLQLAAPQDPALMELVDAQLQRASDLELQARKLSAMAAEHEDWRPNGLVLAAATVEKEAHAAYRSAIAIDPTDPTPYYHLGHALRALGPSTSAESIELFQAAVKLDPLDPATRTSLGYMLIGGSGAEAAARRRRGLKVLARGVRKELWAGSDSVWQHPMEWLSMVPPPPGGVQQRREPYGCMLEPLERQSATMGVEAAALLPRYTVQTEGLARPHGGWRDYEVWKRCGLKAGSAEQQSAGEAGTRLTAPPALAATCAALWEMAGSAPGAMIHSALFSAITPGTVLDPHCGPNNGRFVVHVGLHVPQHDAARLRLGRPSSLNETGAELLALGLPGSEATEVPWREGEGFVWDDSTCHEVVWRGNTSTGADTAERCWNLDTYDYAVCGGTGLQPCWDLSDDNTFDCTEFASCGVDCAGESCEATPGGLPSNDGEGEASGGAAAVDSGEAFAAKKPRIILLLLFFNPKLTMKPVCL